jgi:hypothetical protein
VPVLVGFGLIGAEVCGTALEAWSDGEPAGSIALPAQSATTVRLRLDRDGTVHQYRARATSCTGERSPWGWGAPFRLGAIPDGDARVEYTGHWTRRPLDGADGGAIHTSTIAGDSVSVSFAGRAVAWESVRRPAGGVAQVLVDGRPAGTVDLRSGAVQPRRLVFVQAWPRARAHILTVIVEGTPGRPRVDVDGFLVIR